MNYNLKILIDHSVTRFKQLSIKSKYSINTTYFVNILLIITAQLQYWTISVNRHFYTNLTNKNLPSVFFSNLSKSIE